MDDLPWEDVSAGEILTTLQHISPFKAPGPSGIPNAALQQCQDMLAPILKDLCNACMRLSYHPRTWRTFTTITLRKPGKPDYSKPSAYRGIALLNTISKVLSACVAEDPTYHAEKLGLLPTHQYGGRPGCTTTDTIHTLAQFSKTARKITTAHKTHNNY